jgi:hypothetical protein
MNFQYIVENSHHQMLEGQIQAHSLDDARMRLEELGFRVESLISLGDESEDVTSSDTQLYDFRGIGSDGQFVEGVIESTDRLSAIKFLYQNRAVLADYICEQDASDAEKEYMSKGGMQELFSRLSPEHRVVLSRRRSGSGILADAEKTFFSDIEQLIQDVSDVLSKHGEMISVSEKLHFQSMIQKLLELKQQKDFQSLQHILHDAKRRIYKIRGRHGEILDNDLRIFFEALPDETLHSYAEAIRKFDKRGKLLKHEIARIVRLNADSNSFRRIGIIIKGGYVFTGSEHHPALLEFHRFLGALFLFYLILFGLGYYSVSKNLSVQLSYLQGMIQNMLLFKIIVSLFILYAVITLMLFFSRYHRYSYFVYFSIGGFLLFFIFLL